MKKLLLILVFVLPSIYASAQKSCNFVALNQVEIEDDTDTTISGYFRINDYLLVAGAVKFGLKAEFSPDTDFKFIKLYWDSLCNSSIIDLTHFVLPNEEYKVEGNFSLVFPECDTTYRVFLKFRLFNNTSFVFPLDVKLRTFVGIENTEKRSNLVIFPNPVTNDLYIKTNSEESLLIKLYNSQGKLLQESNETKIDFTNYSKGIYFIKIKDEKHKVIKL
jgi:hypothetical protein